MASALEAGNCNPISMTEQSLLITHSMNSSRRLVSDQVSNRVTPMYPLPSILQSCDTSNPQHVEDNDGPDRQRNQETQPTPHRNVSDIDMIDMNMVCNMYGDLQAADLFEVPNNFPFNMNF